MRFRNQLLTISADVAFLTPPSTPPIGESSGVRVFRGGPLACYDKVLTTTIGRAAVQALIAGCIANHDRAALGARWSVGLRLEDLPFVSLNGRHVTGVGCWGCIGLSYFFALHELVAQPTEDVIDN